MKKVLSLLLAFLLAVPVSLQSFAEQPTSYSDMPNNWSTEAVQAAVDNGLLKGHNFMLRPSDYITRAEAVTIVNRAFGAIKEVNVSSFSDVKQGDWFYAEMAKAIAMGTVQGYNGKLSPNSSITREEVFTIVSRALKLEANSVNRTFLDSNEISSWAKEGIFALINGGYINGSNGYINPKQSITRAEFAQIMHNIIKDYINTSGTKEIVNAGNVLINVPGVTLKGVTVTGDLIIGDGVGEGEVTLEDVTIDGRLLVRGGGENSVIIKGNSNVDTIIIVKIDGKVRILNETGEEIVIVTIEGDDDVILVGNFKNVIIQSPDINVYASNAKVESVNILGERSKLIVDTKSHIKKVTIDATNVVVEGDGNVEQVDVTENGSNAEITTPSTLIDVDKDTSDVTGTGGETIKTETTYKNGSTVNEDAKPVEQSGGGSSGGSSSGGTPPPAVVRYSINYSVVGSNGTLNASVGTGTTVESGTQVTFTATPISGFEIKEWKVNGVITAVIGSSLIRTVSANTTVTVEFKAIEIAPTLYSVTYSVIGTGGTLQASVLSEPISSGTEILAGSSVDFTAVPEEGYKVKAWSVNDAVIDWLTGNNVSRNMIGNVDFKVEFESIPVYEAIVQIVNNVPATVTVKDSGNNNRLPTETIPGNIYVYNLEAGLYSVKAEEEGYYTVETTILIPDNSYIPITMTETLPGVVSVEEFPIYEMNVGGAYPSLPDSVLVTLDTAEEISVSVDWDVSSFDANVADNYTIEGTLLLPDGIDNLMDIQPVYLVDVFAAPEITLNITNSNILRFDFDVPIVWVGEKDITDIGTPEYTTLAFLQDLFNDPTLDATVLNEENIMFDYGFGYFEIELLEDAISRDLFWELDHPWGYFGGNGDGVYRKDVAVNLSIFNNHLGLASESTAKSFKLKFMALYEYGIPSYDAPISGVWQTAEQREMELDPVPESPTYTATINNTNVLRIESNQPIFFEGGPMWAEVDKALLLTQLFGRGEDPGNIADKFDLSKIEITMEDTAFEVQLFSGIFDNELFWNLDHPDGLGTGYEITPYPFDGDGNGVYRKEIYLDLSMFYNALWDWQEGTPIPLWLKLYVPFENGIGAYDEPIQAIWQTVAQSELDDDPIMDSTPPEFVAFDIYPDAVDGYVWVDEGENIVIQISAMDSNLRRVRIAEDRFDSVYGHWYYADSDVYNGPTDADKTAEINEGIVVTYADGTWTINLGPNLSAGIPSIDFVLDFEDYAGNNWSDTVPNPLNRSFSFTFGRLQKGALNEIKEIVNALNPADYTQDSWNVLMNVMTMPETTQAEIDEKVATLDMAIYDLVLYVPVTSIEINDKYSHLKIGERYNLEAIITPSDATNKNVIWSIIEGPGQIDHTGELIANDAGIIVVRATSEENAEIYDELAFTAVYNQPPVPYEGTEEVQSGSTILIDVIALSSDPDGDTLGILGFGVAANGTVVQEGDSIRYTPNPGFIGTDYFEYSISDGVNSTLGSIQIYVIPSGTLIDSISYDIHSVWFYNSSGKLTAVLNGQESTTALLISDSYTSILDIMAMSDNVTIIYMSEGMIQIVEVNVIGSDTNELSRQTISSLNIGGTGSLNTINYAVDNNEVIHFAYRDTHGTTDDYVYDDIMYYNTDDMSITLIVRGYRDYSSSGSWGATYVHEQPHDIGVDVDGNPVVAYYQHNIWAWYADRDNSYFLQLKNPLTIATATLESVSVSNIEVTGGNDITVEYDAGGTHHTRYFDGATLNEIF